MAALAFTVLARTRAPVGSLLIVGYTAVPDRSDPDTVRLIERAMRTYCRRPT